MRLLSCIVLLSLSGAVPAPVRAQASPIEARKTIEIRATAKVTVSAEIATVKIGYVNEAADKDAVYTGNVRMAKKIVEALLQAGVKPSAIETETISLEREEERAENVPPKALKFSADQEWRIHVAAGDAQKIVDIAVAAGATTVSGVDWDVKDPVALEAKAYAAAIEQAKTIGQQTAAQSGLRLGEIVAIANSINRFNLSGIPLNTSESFVVGASQSIAKIPLTLYPQSIQREASVTITFAIAR